MLPFESSWREKISVSPMVCAFFMVVASRRTMPPSFSEWRILMGG